MYTQGGEHKKQAIKPVISFTRYYWACRDLVEMLLVLSFFSQTNVLKNKQLLFFCSKRPFLCKSAMQGSIVLLSF